jgi:very-short-patch-repair endonuclease
MSFGRIKRHITSQHKETTVDQYTNQYWSTLPLHKPCEVCNKKIVYKYKTCSKECHSLLKNKQLKGIPKPENFMSNEHKNKLSDAHKGKIVSEDTKQKISNSSKGISRNKGKQPMLGKKHSFCTKKQMSKKAKISFDKGERPQIAQKGIKRSLETIEKIFAKRPMNKLEKFVSSILDANNIEYQFQYFIKTKNNVCKSYDFKLKNNNILIEIDGDYWHGGPGVEKHFFKLEEVKENDLLKNQIAIENGYSLIRIWESNIYNQPNIILQKIRELS